MLEIAGSFQTMETFTKSHIRWKVGSSTHRETGFKFLFWILYGHHSD